MLVCMSMIWVKEKSNQMRNVELKVVCAIWNYKSSIHIENKRQSNLNNIGTSEAQSYLQYYDYAPFVIEQKCYR
jgi:hypothetical protein